MSAKTQTKSLQRAASKASPKTPASKLVKPKAPPVATPHALIVLDFKASQNAAKAGVTEYEAFKAVMLAVELKDLKKVSAACADIRKTFGEANEASAAIRCTMLMNARKIEHGGIKDKVVVKGLGRPALIKAIESVSSIRALRKALSDAKPSAMTDNRGGDTKAKGKKATPKPAANVKHIDEGLDIPLDKHAAIEAAIKVLQYVATNFLSLAENQVALTSTYATIEQLKQAAA